MGTADWALVVSLLSLVVSAAGFVWNVWSKFIYPKARLRCSIAMMIFVPRDEARPEVIMLSVTNYGPSDTTVRVIIAKRHRADWRFWRRRSMALLTPMEHAAATNAGGPFAGGLPKKLVVGEEHSFWFPPDFRPAWVEAGICAIGVADVFGRQYWVPRRRLRAFLKKRAEGKAEAAAPVE